MSAYVVHPDHVNYLVAAAYHFGVADRSPHIYHYGPDNAVELMSIYDRDQLVQMLMQENINSVQHRYPNDTPYSLPGPVPTPIADTLRYHPSRIPVTSAQVFSAIRCYEYQSCEHPAWDTSKAKSFCRWLTLAAMRHVPGYDAAMWEVTESEYAEKIAAKRAEIAQRTA